MQCQPLQQPELNYMMLPVEESAADVGGNLIAEKGLTTSSVVLPETSLPDKHGVHEVMEAPLDGTVAPQDASTEQEAAKAAQELDLAQPGDNIFGTENGEGELLCCIDAGQRDMAFVAGNLTSTVVCSVELLGFSP